MKYEVKTKQGKNYIVSDDNAWLWIELERGLGLTMKQAIEKMSNGSLDVITWLLHRASLEAKHTEVKTQKTWVETEFDSFEVVEEDPKATQTEALDAV